MKPARTKITSTRLGAKFSGSSLGWALVQESGCLPSDRVSGDPLALALAAVPEGGHVDLICYSDEASFAQSQAAKDGLTRLAHVDFVINLRRHLRAHGRSAEIKWVTVET